MWNRIAQFIVRRPRLIDWLISRASRNPYTHIVNSAGEVYMRRFWLFNSFNSRWHIKWLPSIRMHHILLPDEGPHMHDHPWDFRTIILRGWYAEEKGRFFPTYSIHTAGSTLKRSRDDFHRISAVGDGGAWTLFVITSPRENEWGFWTGDTKVPWRQYLARKSAPSKHHDDLTGDDCSNCGQQTVRTGWGLMCPHCVRNQAHCATSPTAQKEYEG